MCSHFVSGPEADFQSIFCYEAHLIPTVKIRGEGQGAGALSEVLVEQARGPGFGSPEP